MPDENAQQGGSGETGGDKGGEFKAPATQDELNRIIESRLARERAKFADYDDIKAKAAEFDKAAEASKTELQKAVERAEAAEKRAAEFEAKEQRKAWATEVASETGVPAEVLRGSSKEELLAHAESLKPHFTKAPPKKIATPPGTSREDKGGSRAAAALRELRRGA